MIYNGGIPVVSPVTGPGWCDRVNVKTCNDEQSVVMQ